MFKVEWIFGFTSYNSLMLMIEKMKGVVELVQGVHGSLTVNFLLCFNSEQYVLTDQSNHKQLLLVRQGGFSGIPKASHSLNDIILAKC